LIPHSLTSLLNTKLNVRIIVGFLLGICNIMLIGCRWVTFAFILTNGSVTKMIGPFFRKTFDRPLVAGKNDKMFSNRTMFHDYPQYFDG
jgi:hypothetical protein